MVDTQVNQTGGGDDGRAGLYALLAIIIALIIVAMILFIPRGTDDRTRDIDADIRIEMPDAPDRDGGQDPGQGATPPGDGGASPNR